MASSSSSGSSSSTSGSYIPDYPQSPILMSIAQYAQSLAPQMLQWGQQVYQHNQQLADSIVNEGNLYASPERIKSDMGMAEARVQQGSDQALQAHKRDLAAYGIDPSSGRYDALDRSEKMKAAAAAAGAGNQQRMATEATGRAIRSEGANLSLANAASGANLMRLPNEYLRTGMELKYPPLGQTSNSQSHQQSQSSSPESQGGQRGGGQGDGGGGSRGGGGGGGGNYPGSYGHSGDGGSSGGSSSGGYGNRNNAQVMNVPGRGGQGGGGGGGDQDQLFPDYGYGDSSDQLSPSDPNYDPYSAYDPNNMGGQGDVWGTNDNTSWDSNWGQQYTGGGDWQQGTQGTFNGDWGETPVDYSDNSGGSQWGTADSGGDYSDSFDFAEGGYVPAEMSPSGGEQVDDVPAQIAQTGGQAQLNVDEFVMPRDVVMWKGQEFFQKLIQQSRKNRVSAPAQPSMGQANG